MRKVFTFMVAVFLTATLWAQSPEKMSYQAVIRNTSDALVTNTQIGMQISILQGSATGTEVYVETQNPTTNSNGLVSIEIGGGIVVNGDFETIDWANGSYFIKTETAVEAPLTTYTITGTSQILSVPYALYAKTAESISGEITESDPLYTAWDKDYDDLINKPTIPNQPDGSETKVTAGTNITVTGAGTIASPYVVNSSGTTTYSVGDVVYGGIIIWLDETGQHGIVCAIEDQDMSGTDWYAGTNGATQAKGDGPYAGRANTSIIIAAHVAIGDNGNPYAARICNEYISTVGNKTYGDWYLPSKEELDYIFQNKDNIETVSIQQGGGGFANAPYWSSTEKWPNDAWLQYFSSGTQEYDGKYTNSNVRCVRAF